VSVGDIGYLAAFLGGVLTLLSPCGALLLPSFLAYAFDRPTQLLGRTAVFTAGLATTLVPLGMGAASLARVAADHRTTVVTVAGWAVVALGIVTALGGGLRVRAASRAQDRLAVRTSTPAVFGLGAVYGFAGFCSGPILGAVLLVAAADGRPLQGGAMLAVYALGMAAPLFLLALGWERFELGRRRWLRGRTLQLGRLRLHTTSLLAGIAFVAVGVLFLTTGGTAGGVPGLPASAEAEQAAQLWVQRVATRVPDLALVGVVAAAAATMLVVRAGRLRAAATRSVPARR
jgi:cytochrome c biogenesis protein CcdA